jgi:hypothetical protein
MDANLIRVAPQVSCYGPASLPVPRCSWLGSLLADMIGYQRTKGSGSLSDLCCPHRVVSLRQLVEVSSLWRRRPDVPSGVVGAPGGFLRLPTAAGGLMLLMRGICHCSWRVGCLMAQVAKKADVLNPPLINLGTSFKPPLWLSS